MNRPTAEGLHREAKKNDGKIRLYEIDLTSGEWREFMYRMGASF
jgi:hypothetical protein